MSTRPKRKRRPPKWSTMDEEIYADDVDSVIHKTLHVKVEPSIHKSKHAKVAAVNRDENCDYIIPDDISQCIDDGPMQPRMLSYPKTVFGHTRVTRSFCPNWFDRFPWLEYSVSTDRAYCFACRHFSDPTSKKLSVYASSGFCKWSKAHERLHKHNNSAQHLRSMEPWLEDTLRRENEAGIKDLTEANEHSNEYTDDSKQNKSADACLKHNQPVIFVGENKISGKNTIILTSFAKKLSHPKKLPELEDPEIILPPMKLNPDISEKGGDLLTSLASKLSQHQRLPESDDPEIILPPMKLNPEDVTWCTCCKCSSSQLNASTCCQKVKTVKQRMDAVKPPVKCITDHPGFEAVCLNPWVIQVAYYQHLQDVGELTVKKDFERYRYISYCQFVRWCWGCLQEDMQIPLPSCVVSRIKSVFNQTTTMTLPSLVLPSDSASES